MTFEPLNSGSPSEIVLKISNPTRHLTSLQFLPYNEKNGKSDLIKEDSSDSKKVINQIYSFNILLFLVVFFLEKYM